MAYKQSLIDYANELFKLTLSEDNVDLSAPIKLNDATGFEDPEVRNTEVRFTNKTGGETKVDLLLRYNRLDLGKLAGLKNNRFTIDHTPSSTHAVLAELSAWLGREITADDIDDVPPSDGLGVTVFRLWAKPGSYGFAGQAEVRLIVEVPLNLRVSRNSWSDFRIALENAPVGVYRVEFMDHVAGTAVVAYRALSSDQTVLNFSAEDASAAYEQNVDFLSFNLYRADESGEKVGEAIATYAAIPEIDNSHVVKVVAMGLNSLIGGYFNDLSDLSNPGGTGRPGRKDSIAAATFRREMGLQLGLSVFEILPVMTVVGSSPINPMPYQAGFPLDNYWWNPDTNQPGPDLIYADGIVKSIGRAPDYFVESGPGETTGIWFAPEEDRPAILAAWRTSNIAMLQWMRENWGNPELEIWFQGASTSWWGIEAPPREINWIGAHLLRNTQTAMALENNGFKMGSYIPNGGKYEVYLNENASGMGWVHYTPEGYHAAAQEMGEALALNINRAENPPAWTTMVPPTGLKALKRTDGTIRLSWDDSGPKYRVHILHPVTALVVGQVDAPDNFYILTVAEQLSMFGFEANYAHYMVAETDAIDGDGPFAEFEGGTSDPSLQTPENLKATKRTNGDVVFSWDARGQVKYYIRHYRIGGTEEQGPYLFEGEVNTNEFIFTRQQQIDAYGGEVLYVRADVYEYDPVQGTMSDGAYWNGDAEGDITSVQNPTGGMATRDAENNITQTWDALDATSWRVTQMHVGNGTVLYTRVITEPSILFTAQEQRDAYTYTAGFVQWTVVAIRDDLESAEVGFAHDFNA